MMMKRSELKRLVKQCLIEILQEGLGAIEDSVETQVPPMQENVQRRRPAPAPAGRRTGLDAISYGGVKTQPRPQAGRPMPNSVVTEAIKTVSNGDSTMASIFADTIKTTMQEQMAHDRKDPNALAAMADPVAKAVDAHDPADLFGDEAAGKWAALAFMDKKLPGQ